MFRILQTIKVRRNKVRINTSAFELFELILPSNYTRYTVFRVFISCTVANIVTSKSVVIATIFSNQALHDILQEKVNKATATNAVLQRVNSVIATGWPRKRPNDECLLAYFHVERKLRTEAGVVYRGNRAVIPQALCKRDF